MDSHEQPSKTGLGVNLIGDVASASGLSTATRAALDALLDSGFPVSFIQLLYPFERRESGVDIRYHGLMRGSLYPLNLMFYNMNELVSVPDDLFWELTRGKYTIGFWYWELLELPKKMQEQAKRVDEIWVASNYTARSMLSFTKRPVVVVPTPVHIAAAPRLDRARYGIPDDRFVFFFNFSAMSSDARKNPWGLIEAFRRAFGRPRGRGAPLLVIKGQHLDRFPEMYRELRAQIERIGGMLLSADYSRQEMNDLLACSDVYVSLHRSEGFGLGMAESMCLGKPVIATNYSSNTDFMTEENSYLVEYRLRPIVPEDHRFTPGMDAIYANGQLWADPDLDQAAALMRHVHEHQDEARERGARAAKDIREFCSPPVVARLVAERLSAIEPSAPRPKPATGAQYTLTTGDVVEQQRNAILHWEDAVSIERRVPLRRTPVAGQAMRALTRLASLGRSAQAQVQVNRAVLHTSRTHADEIAALHQRIADLETQYDELKQAVAGAVEEMRRSAASTIEQVTQLSARVGEMQRVSAPVAQLDAPVEEGPGGAFRRGE